MPYAKVVEAFNRGETVVPMRYGCRFKSVTEVRLAPQRADQFHALLARLDGCVEMGVRALQMEAAGGPRRCRRSEAGPGCGFQHGCGLPRGAAEPFRDHGACRTHRADRPRRAVRPLSRVDGRDPRGGRQCDGVVVLPGRARCVGRLSHGLWRYRRRAARP